MCPQCNNVIYGRVTVTSAEQPAVPLGWIMALYAGLGCMVASRELNG